MTPLYCRMSWLIIAILVVHTAYTQEAWPKSITTADATVIDIYQPQTEFFAGNTMRSRFAVSVQEKGMADPEFGVFWSTATVGTDRDTREVIIESTHVNNIRIPADSTLPECDHLKFTLETYLPRVIGALPLDEVLGSLDENQEETQLSTRISHRLPRVYFRTKPTMLVLIDGKPILKKNSHWGLEMVINSPFNIFRAKDGRSYLLGAGHWYSATEPTGPFAYSDDKVPHKLKRIAKALRKAAARKDDLPVDESVDHPIYDIIVSTTPAQLIQTDGDPNLAPISGTSLLYVTNTDNDVFVDTETQQYYVLLSGRWYRSSALNENSAWKYVASQELPNDFARIPEGSPKDGVLASVAGTQAAREAVMDAEVPQTAKIDRRTAETQVVYDGRPQFQPIAGTDLDYATNTSSTVLQEGGRYFAVDNGIWFTSSDPSGPWQVSNDRPREIDLIPPDCPVYNSKYVYIYDSTPDYVYDGYTPGYLNSFVDGPTVVYGTGYDYSPWMGDYYYPRPWTWGFDMCYNPWSGWGFGAGYDYDWFDDGFGWDFDWGAGLGFGWGGWYGGGWWGGASAYRPAYRNWHGGRFRSDRRGGYYGENAIIRGDTHMHMRYGNNVYRDRPGVVPRVHTTGERFGQGGLAAGGNGYIYTDRSGNIYRRTPQGEWQQRSNRSWSVPGNRGYLPSVQRQRQMNARGQIRSMNFQRASRYGGMRFGGGTFGGGHFGGGRIGGGHLGSGHFGGHR